MSLLSINQLDFSYQGNDILSNINVSFRSSEMVGLIGPNGAGKSTLMNLIVQLIKQKSGSILLQNKEISSYSRKELAREMTLIPQNTNVPFAFSVEEIVMMGRHPYLGSYRPPSPEDVAIVKDALRQTNVDLFSDRMINTLSGGERQRVFIARAIAQQTPIVLLDEATANLDLCHQLEMLELAKSLTQQGCLVIAAIHDLMMASRFCDRLVLLADNTIQADGLPEDVLTKQNLARYFHLQAEIHHDPCVTGVNITPQASLHCH